MVDRFKSSQQHIINVSPTVYTLSELSNISAKLMIKLSLVFHAISSNKEYDRNFYTNLAVKLCI